MGRPGFRFEGRHWVVLVLLLGLLFHPIKVGDLYGYLVFGEHILSSGAIPHRDVFSFTAFGESWIDHEWLFQLVVALVYRITGWTGLAVLQLLLILVLVLGVGRLRMNRDRTFLAWTASLLLLGAALFPGLVLRPQLFSYGSLIVLFLLFREWANRPGYWEGLIAVLFAVWANVHGAFIVGLGVLALFGAAECTREDSSLTVQRWFILIGTATVATLFNPYGVELWRMILETLFDPLTGVVLDEWQPSWSSGYHLSAWGVLFGWYAYDGLRSMAGASRSDRLRLLALGVFALAALVTKRNLTYFALAQAAYGTSLPLRAPSVGVNTEVVQRGLLVGGLFGGLWLLGQSLWTGAVQPPGEYPETSPKRWMTDGKHRVFTRYEWADWLLFHARDVKIFLDQRWKTVYSSETIKDYFRCLDGDVGLLDDYDVDYVFLRPADPLSRGLAERPGWETVREVEGSVLYRRVNHERSWK